MEKHNAEWHKQRAMEKRQRPAARQNYQANRARRDMDELEALKNQLLKEARKK